MAKGEKNIAQRVAVGIICAAVLSYTVFHMISLFAPEISTVVVRSATEQTVLEFDGHIFRDETVLYSSYGGAVDYIADDGDKVGIGEKLAVVYEQGSNSSLDGTIEAIDKKIDMLEKSCDEDVVLSNLPEISEAADVNYLNIVKRLAQGDVRGVSEEIDDMTGELAKVSILVDENSPVPETLASLYERREQLNSVAGNSTGLVADTSGYFYSAVDGYESVFNYAAADTLSVSDYDKLVMSKAQGSTEKGYAVGKMAYDIRWRFVAVLPYEDSVHFKDGETYSATFDGEGDFSLPLYLERSEKDSSTSSVLMVFSCDRMPEGFSFARAQSVSVVVNSVTGISVPKSAVHRAGGNYYVYILRGSVVIERRIEVIYEGRDYYTVMDGKGADEEELYLQSNDNLILSGKNLFDGRIVD